MSEVRTKKLINQPENIITEALAGMVSAHPELIKIEGPTGRGIIAVNGPRDGKVGLVTGGGSGHEPLFSGYVGRGLMDGAAVGNVFASPSPEQILDAAHAVDGGAGVIFIYGNYTGDVMNFDMAAEEMENAGTPVRSLPVHDDVASATADKAHERRGVAGNVFVFKIAGAAADQGLNLDQVEAAAHLAMQNTRSMGVALSACSLPQTGKLNFEIGHDEMEIGMGIHGEPGMRRGKLGTADAVADELLDPIISDLSLKSGDEVAVLVNGLGATGLLELYILQNRVAGQLSARGVNIHKTLVGEYATSLEMAGASITVMKLEGALKAWLDAPCESLALTVSGEMTPVGQLTKRNHAHEKSQVAVDRSTLNSSGQVTPEIFRSAIFAVADAISENVDWLSELDGVIGDGDHGVTMNIGFTAVREAVAEDATISEMSQQMAKAFLDAVGASTGPLYASAFQCAATKVEDRLNLDGCAMSAWISGILEGILSRGGATLGDKTMVDVWIPAVQSANESGSDIRDVLNASVAGALKGRDATKNLESKRGRSKKLGARSVGHIDPGAASAHIILDAFRKSILDAI